MSWYQKGKTNLDFTAFYFILWAVVSAAYPALFSCSYFERINDDDDDNVRNNSSYVLNCYDEVQKLLGRSDEVFNIGTVGCRLIFCGGVW